MKIEFFRKSLKPAQGSLKKNTITDDFTIKPPQGTTSISFGGNMLVSELENQFAEKFKLSAQIFRKSGKIWIETTFTDSWSLKKQNQEGMELSQL